MQLVTPKLTTFVLIVTLLCSYCPLGTCDPLLPDSCGQLYQEAQENKDPRLDQANKLDQQIHELVARGKLTEALPLAKDALKLRQAVLKPDDPEVAYSFNTVGFLLGELGRFFEALPFQEEALQLAERNPPKDIQDLAIPYENLANLLNDLADYAGARRNLERALQIKEKWRNEEPTSRFRTAKYVESLNNLAKILYQQGDYPSARQKAEQALSLIEGAYGKDDPRVLESVALLGSLLDAMGEYRTAIPLHLRALDIIVRYAGPAQSELTTLIGKFSDRVNDYATAKSIQELALKKTEQQKGLDHPDLTPFLDNLAILNLAEGNLVAARPLYERSMRIRERALGTEHPDYARSLSNLAIVLQSQGDYGAAKPLFEKALNIFRKSLGPVHPEVGSTLNSLALMLQVTQRYEEARLSYEESLRILEKGLGPNHDMVALILSNLGLLLQTMGRSKEAREYLERSLAIRQKSFGQEHIEVARTLINIASVDQSLNDYVSAQRRCEEALRIAEKLLSREHPFVSVALDNLGLVNWAQNDITGARKKFLRAGELANLQTQQLLPTLSFAEQRALLATQVPLQISILLSSNREGADLRDAYGLFLRWKGLLIDSLRSQTATARLRQDPKYQRAVERLSLIRRELAGWYQKAGTVSLEQWKRNNDELTREKEQIERELSQGLKPDLLDDPVSDSGLRVFQSVLRSDEAFVDIYRYGLLEKGKPAGDHYGAVVTGLKDGPSFVDLGSTKDVNSAINAWRIAVLSGDLADSAWQSLSDVVWKRVAALLPAGTRKVFVSPDGELARIPWNLFASGPGSAKQLLVSHTDSARELIRLRKTTVNKNERTTMLLAGGIDFNGGSGDSLSTGRFLALPGSESELELVRLLAKARGIETTPLSGSGATKDAVIDQLSKVSFAHLATHGFFQRSVDTESPIGTSPASAVSLNASFTRPRNPLVESGIALAGANVRDPSTMEEKGLLTAEEIVGLDLSRCSLVTLSACETGRGEEVTGQGVLGLRATIIAAGARSMIMSLWKVDDKAAAKLMAAFYENLWVKKLPKAEALRQAQRTLRDDASGNYRLPVYWAAWVLVGEGW